jgi:hypothetical protein
MMSRPYARRATGLFRSDRVSPRHQLRAELAHHQAVLPCGGAGAPRTFPTLAAPLRRRVALYLYYYHMHWIAGGERCRRIQRKAQMVTRATRDCHPSRARREPSVRAGGCGAALPPSHARDGGG